jgi:hypothetical protein
MSILTRNFYDRTSVESALMSSVIQKNPLRKQLILFWANELRLSREYEKLFEVLTRAWFQCPPTEGALATWLRLHENPSDGDRILNFLHFLHIPVQSIADILEPYAPPNINIIAIKPRAGEEVPTVPTDWSESQRVVLWRAVRDAVKNRKGKRLYCLLGSFPASTVVAYLPEILGANPHLLRAYKKHRRGLIQILGSLGHWPLEPQPLTSRPEWPKLAEGRLGSRLFCIPVKYRRIPLDGGGLDILTGCKFWQEVLKGTGIDVAASREKGFLVFDTDEACEKFYEQFFPDDIPDEWPADEKSKSHLVAGDECSHSTKST